jgi:hypothetical protein
LERTRGVVFVDRRRESMTGAATIGATGATQRGDDHGADRIRVRIVKSLKVFRIISVRGRFSAPELRARLGG